MKLERSAGILLHPTSFPNGVLDEHAYRFVDWLAAAGQRWWQVLPLGPPDATGSPYMSPSAFAGSPALLADPEAGVTATELADFRARNAYWLDDWVALGGSANDQVRFEREWQALRSYAAARCISIFATWRSTLRRAAQTIARIPSSSSAASPGVPPDLPSATGQPWGTRCTTEGDARRRLPLVE
jgi:4-alpha-glucanotransferase